MCRGRRFIGNHQPVKRRLAYPERHFAAQNTISGAALAGNDQAPIRALSGWRRAIFGELALRLKHGEIALAIRNEKILLIEHSEKTS